MSDTNDTKKDSYVPPENPAKEMEFEEFLQLIGDSRVNNWSEIAEALGVDRSTITRWRKTPQARIALIHGVNKAIEKMEETGGGDWRMWRERANMLGVVDKKKIDHELEIPTDMPIVQIQYVQPVPPQEKKIDDNQETNTNQDQDRADTETGSSVENPA